MEHLQLMYNFMGVNFGAKEREAVPKFTHSNGTGEGYYSTFRFVGYHRNSCWQMKGIVLCRRKDFNPNKWRTGLDLKDIRRIEESCSEIMKILNYEASSIL